MAARSGGAGSMIEAGGGTMSASVRGLLQATRDLRVRDLMRRPEGRADVETSLGVARERMLKQGIHHLLVYDGDRFVGVLSDRDILRHLSPRIDTNAEKRDDTRTLEQRVFRAASYRPVTIDPEATLLAAAAKLLEAGVSCLPVTEEGEVIGVVTSRDLLRTLVSCPV